MKTHNSAVYSVVLVALFAALTVVLGYMGRIYVGPIPITMQSLAVMLSGAALGAVRGSFAVMVVLLLAVCGIPTLSTGVVGMAVFSDIMAGYRIGWVLGAFTTGLIVQYGLTFIKNIKIKALFIFISCLIGGVIIVYICGVLWAAWLYDTPWEKLWKAWVLPFILPDIIKAFLASFIILNLIKFKILQN